MQPASTICWKLNLFGWPCLSQSEWASWIQVVAAIVGIGLALYIPVRMKRLDDLERMRSVISRLETLRDIATRFVTIFNDPTNAQYPSQPEIKTAKEACEALVQDTRTDAIYIPALGRTIEAARIMLHIWSTVAAGGGLRDQHKPTAQGISTDTRTACEEAQTAITAWKRKHWLALFMHG